LLDSSYAVDRFVLWALLPAFLFLAVYGSLSGMTQELAALGSSYPGFNIAGFPHEEALGLGSWIVFGLLLVAMIASFWERRHSAYLLGAVAVLAGTIPLLAGRFESQIATATAWRWLAATFLLLGSIAIWSRRTISERTGWSCFRRDGFVEEARTLLFVLTIVPLLILTSYPALRAVFYMPVQSPTSGFFSLFDNDFVYGVPLVLTGLVLIGYAVRERMPSFALYAGAFFNVTVTLAFLLAVVSGHGLMDRLVLVRLVQLNVITLAVYLLPWLSTRKRWQSALDQRRQRIADQLLKLQLWLAISLSAGVLLPALFSLVLFPLHVGAGTFAAGSSLGWLSLLAIAGAVAWLAITRTIKVSPWMLAAFLLAVSCMIAFNFAALGGWHGLHILTVCTAATAWLLLAAAELPGAGSSWRATARNLSAIVGGGAVYLSLHALLSGAEYSAWWSIGPLLTIAALAVTLNLRTKVRAHIYTAGLLFGISTSLWWLLIAQESFHVSEFLLVNLVANSLAGIVWLWLDLRSRQRESSVSYYFSFHNLAAVFMLGVFALLLILSFAYDTPHLSLVSTPLTWPAFAAVVSFMTACLWDRYAKYAVAGLYTLGVIGCAIALQQLSLTSELFAWSATIAIATYSLCAALAWHWRAQLIGFARRCGIPERFSSDGTELPWFAAFLSASVRMGPSSPGLQASRSLPWRSWPCSPAG
jgi:hypothetical protein